MNLFASIRLKSRRAIVLITAACIPLTLSAAAQDKPAAPAASNTAGSTSTRPTSSANPASFAYEVVSIKPDKMGSGVPISIDSTADGISYRGADLLDLIINAYPTQVLDQLSGLPEWANPSTMNDERFDVEAKMDEETAAALKKLPQEQQQELRRSMLQQVLADRFDLKVHKETRELPIFNLVVAKNGPKFMETAPDKKINENYGWAEISGDDIKISQIIGMISGNARRYVVDKTGLTGKYTLSLKWNPIADQNSPAWFADQYPQFKNRPDLFMALEDQLGLKLEPAKGPVDVYVIDHVEKPSPD